MSNKRLHIIYGSIIAVMALALWIFYTIGKNGGFADAEKLAVPVEKFVSVSGNAPDQFLNIRGTWRIDEEKTGYPKHSDEYLCSQSAGTCTMSEGLVSGNVLMVNSARFDIVKWDDQEVVLKSGDSCRTNTIFVDLVSQDVKAVLADTRSEAHQFVISSIHR